MNFTMMNARVGAGMTMKQVAEKMGITAETYSKMEKNSDRMTIREAKLFGEAVGVHWSDIFFGDDSNLNRGDVNEQTDH